MPDGGHRLPSQQYLLHQALQASKQVERLLFAASTASEPAFHRPDYVLPPNGVDLAAEVERFQRSLITQALERTGGNKARAAELLRLNRTTLVEKLKAKWFAP